MANIYGRSTLTVAATMSAGLDGDLFHFLPPDCLDRQVSVAALPKEAPPLYYRRDISHYELQSCMDTYYTEVYYMAYPLTRAWAFQEHLLSPRIAHFTTRELVWECSTTMSCCCSPTITISPGLQKKVAPLLGNNTCKLSIELDQDLFILWYEEVSCYMTKYLTKESDRLPALSGVAKKAQA
jgi:hypothetical protein